MVFSTDLNKFRGLEIMDQYDRDESISITAAEATLFTIDSRKIRDSVISFSNTNASTMTIKIYGSAKGQLTPDIPAFPDISWFNLLNTASTVTPSNYNNNKSVGILQNVPWYESFSNQWAWVIVRGNLASGSGTVEMWHRGMGR